MADGIFNIAKGAFVEKVRDSGSVLLVLLLKANEAESTLIDRDTVALMLAEAGTTESTDGSYARKTAITGTIDVDDTNDLVDVDIPDQTWTGLTGETMTKLIVAYEESAADSGRIPLSHHDFAVTTDGSDITAEFNAEGFARAS